VSCTATFVNAFGLHARAAARFVKVAGAYRCQVKVGRGARIVDGKSILGLLLLAAARGSQLAISAEGADEAAALAALCDLAARGFEDP
jgi:phosphotransferase system HPr (HPr) family protein